MRAAAFDVYLLRSQLDLLGTRGILLSNLPPFGPFYAPYWYNSAAPLDRLANTSSVTFLSGSAGRDGACYYKYRELKFSEDNFAGMQIYFGFTVAGDRSAVTAARKIVGILEEMRHEVLTRHLVEDNAWEADRSLTPREVYLRGMKWLDQCDIVIAEH